MNFSIFLTYLCIVILDQNYIRNQLMIYKNKLLIIVPLYTIN